MKLYTDKNKSIMCPYCKKFLTKADKEDPRTHQLKCKKCGKLILFVPKTGEFKIKKAPERTTSSGMVFY